MGNPNKNLENQTIMKIIILTNPGNSNKNQEKPNKKLAKSKQQTAKSKLKSGKPKHEIGEIQKIKNCLDFP
jgi:hypothetical protein